MVKMVGSYTRPEELLAKLVNENSYLKKQIKELKEENSRLRKITEGTELANLQSDDIVTYEEWFNSETSDKLIEAYTKYYN